MILCFLFCIPVERDAHQLMGCKVCMAYILHIWGKFLYILWKEKRNKKAISWETTQSKVPTIYENTRSLLLESQFKNWGSSKLCLCLCVLLLVPTLAVPVSPRQRSPTTLCVKSTFALFVSSRQYDISCQVNTCCASFTIMLALHSLLQCCVLCTLTLTLHYMLNSRWDKWTS